MCIYIFYIYVIYIYIYQIERIVSKKPKNPKLPILLKMSHFRLNSSFFKISTTATFVYLYCPSITWNSKTILRRT